MSPVARRPERKMPVRLLIAVLIVLFICLLAVAVDWALKAIKRNRRRLDATRRLAAAAAHGEGKHRRREASQPGRGGATSVMPTIHDIAPRHVDEPAPDRGQKPAQFEG